MYSTGTLRWHSQAITQTQVKISIIVTFAAYYVDGDKTPGQ